MPLTELKSSAKQFQAERLATIRRDPNFRVYFRKPDADFPTFADLHRHHEAYHGRLVTFRGHVRRLISSPAGENAHGFQQMHEAWLYADGAQQNPVVVVCTELPPNMPTGSDILVDFVSATGYFFKRYGYEDRSGQPRFTPADFGSAVGVGSATGTLGVGVEWDDVWTHAGGGGHGWDRSVAGVAVSAAERTWASGLRFTIA